MGRPGATAYLWRSNWVRREQRSESLESVCQREKMWNPRIKSSKSVSMDKPNLDSKPVGDNSWLTFCFHGESGPDKTLLLWKGIALLPLSLWCPDNHGLERYTGGYYMKLYLRKEKNLKINCTHVASTLFRIQWELHFSRKVFMTL